MAQKPKISSAEAAAYLKRCDPRLKLGQWIGGGGFGDVYELEGTEPAMVLKIMDTRCIVPCEQVNARIKKLRREVKKYLEEEAVTMRTLGDCDRIMPLLRDYQLQPEADTGEWVEDVSACIVLLVMPKLIPLTRYIAQRPLNEENAVRLLRDMAQALTACAEHQIIHGDIKPDNIFVSDETGSPRFVLGDFGVSSSAELRAKLRMEHQVFSHYRAPELLSGSTEAGAGSDLYSLGVTVYECMTHTYPYPQNVTAAGLRVPVIGHISQELFDIICLMLERDPNERYSHPTQLAQMLNNISATRSHPAKQKDYATAVRALILAGDYAQAIRTADEGIRSQELSCTRLKALAVLRAAPDNPGRFKKVREILANAYLNGDPGSVFLQGFIFGQERKWTYFARDLSTAAQAGSIPACYLYGRTLYFGGCEACPRDPEQGLEYLCKAARAGYYPALRILHREDAENPALELPADLRAQLRGQEYRQNDPREREAMISFL